MNRPRSLRANLSVVGHGDSAGRAKRDSGPVLRQVEREPIESDATLVARARNGDAGSKESLYRKHVDYIAGMSARLLRSVEASEDVVQDAFVLAFEHLPSLRDPGAFRGWLAAIAVSQVRRRLSRQRLLRALGLDRSFEEAPLDELVCEDVSAEVRSELAALDVVLRELPAKHRIAWMLRHVEGEPLEDVARSCECSLATAKRWIGAAEARVNEHVVIAKEELR
jgi:RNA polymerase sigma-70 factor (ECF subfamily)